MTIKILNQYQYSYIRIQITYIGIRIYIHVLPHRDNILLYL